MASEIEVGPEVMQSCDAWYWVYYNKVRLRGVPYEFKNHVYQMEWLSNKSRVTTYKKAAQMGGSEAEVLRVLHGMIYGRYAQGVLVLFPTRDDVTDFSKGRFNPLIVENPVIGRWVADTDAANIKKVGGKMLYFRGAKSSGKIDNSKSTSSQLKSVPVDKIVFDEKDEMEVEMIALSLERMSHSNIQEITNISTPTIPGYGIDKSYNESDQSVWMLKCKKCGGRTCLELEFPDCIVETENGWVRLCKHCRDSVLNPDNGEWVARVPSLTKEHRGFWISQLNSAYVNPGKILDMYNNPGKHDYTIAEVYNSKLGMAYVEAENQLTKAHVYACCTLDAMRTSSVRSTAMGVDVGKELHVTIGYKINEKQYRIIYMARLTEFEDLHDLVYRFNVKVCVIDMEPETRKAREFQQSHQDICKIMLCDYQDRLKVKEKRDDQKGLITVRRTEVCDMTHDVIMKNLILLPRRSPEVDEYAEEMTNIAKVLETDNSGSKRYKYRDFGKPDHYYHSTNYVLLACRDYMIESDYGDNTGLDIAEAKEYDPFAYI